MALGFGLPFAIFGLSIAMLLALWDPNGADKDVNCEAPSVPIERDSSAAALVRDLERRQALAGTKNPDATLRSIHLAWQGGTLTSTTFIFTGSDGAAPVVYVASEGTGEPTALVNPNAKSDYSDRPLLLDSLRSGPIEVASMITSEVSGVGGLLLTLVEENCELVWHVKGLVVGGAGAPQKEFEGMVSEAGQFTWRFN